MIRLMSYNIRFGGRGREDHLLAAIRAAAPDVVVFQEATRPGVVASLAKATGMKAWDASPRHSVGFMSRLEVSHHSWHRPAGTRRAYMKIVLAETGLRLYGVHLTPVHSNWTEGWRARELKAMLAALEQEKGTLHLLAGDFNTLAPNETFDPKRLPPRLRLLAWIGGRTIRWQTIQVMLDADYVDGFRLLHPDDAGPTFPTWDPHVRLDYVFVPRTATGRLRSCVVLDGPETKIASDHFPLLAEVEAS